jgi:transitional endoplasmic reticulum ATPase
MTQDTHWDSWTEKVRNFLDLEQLVELAQKLEDKLATDANVQVRTVARPFSSIPRQGNIPRSPANTASDKVTDRVIITPPPADSSPTTELVGGLDQVLAELRNLVEIPLQRPDILQKLGLEVPRGVLLVGAPGTGKTLTARYLAQKLGCHFLVVNAPELMSKYYGESEARLRQIFATARQHSPCVLFIDEIDAIAPKREQVEGEVEKRLVAQLLTLMDGFEPAERVIVLAATNRPAALDPALRRPGRFEREILFPIPDRQGRLQILQIHTQHMPLASDVNLDNIADKTAGCVGADLKGLCQEAARIALSRQVTSLDQIPETLEVSQSDFDQALEKVKPAVLRSYVLEKPQVSWEQIGGLDEAKRLLQEAIAGAFLHAELYAHTRAQSPKGILLYGAPGTGKTLLAKAVATQAQANFISLSGASLVKKWVGESERTIQETFAQARQAAPCVIFIDELDTIAPARGNYQGDSGVSDRLVGQLLTEIDGISSSAGLLIIAATNRRSAIDPALLRSGRIELHILVDLPDLSARLEILRVHNQQRPLAPDVNLRDWAERTAGWNGADLAFLSNRAAIAAIARHPHREGLAITNADWEKAWAEVQQSKTVAHESVA